MLEEFKKFAMRGNVVDMTVGIVIRAPDTKACPECLSNIMIAARRCKFCTSQVD
jgi:large-conductance mechanosensitive channel